MHMVGVAKDSLMCVDFVTQSVTLSSHPKTSLCKGMKGRIYWSSLTYNSSKNQNCEKWKGE